MIGLIGEGIEIVDGLDGSVLNWFDCPMLSRKEMLAAIKRQGGVDGRSVNLFVALERPPRSNLLDLYLSENLLCPGSHYVYVTPDPARHGFGYWRPVITEVAVKLRTVAPCALFSNTLSFGDTPPSERTYNAGFTVYTIEFDHLPIEDQLRIIYAGELKRIGIELQRYLDYRGYEAVYSGAKSVHFHFVFDLRHLKHELAFKSNGPYQDRWTSDLPDVLLRPSYEVCWQRLAQIFRNIAEVDDEPDPQLRLWEQLRRCPWALRQIRGAHPLGLPPDHRIPQVVLASDVFKNTKRGATEWFHEPASLVELCRGEHTRRRRSKFVEHEVVLRSTEMELFKQHAPEMFRRLIGAEFPAFADSEVNRHGLKCYFRNDLDDEHPSSFCEGDRDRILLQGRHNFLTDGIALPTTPNQIFDWIITQSEDTASRAEDWIIRRYRAVVHDRESLARFLDDYMVEMAAPAPMRAMPEWIDRLAGRRHGQNTHVLVRGPQGCGKSTTILRKIPNIYESDPGVILVSSPSIAQAKEKIDAFRRVNRDERFVPYLYLSLTALYERFCPPAERLDHVGVLEDGGSSWLHAVYEQQHHVYEQMFSHRRDLFNLVDAGKIPVLFGTHETMRQHAAGGITRLFYARDFDQKWFEPMSIDDRQKWRSHLLHQNCVHRVIVDEVTAHDLLSIHRYETVQWVQRGAKEIGFSNTADLAERFTNFREYLAAHRCDGEAVTWDVFNQIVGCDYDDEHIVEVSDREVPFDEMHPDGIYRRMVGRRYYVSLRSWWNDFWRVTLLTTEAVPTRIIEAIDREAAARDEVQHDRFKVYEFGLPDWSRDTVTVELQRGCKKATLPDLVRAYSDCFPNAAIITDMVKARLSEVPVTTHVSAKGSNNFIESDIIAFYTSPSPALFSELGALNTRFGRSDLVRLFYCDQFDQTCGRNRGFRGQRSRDHKAIFPPRLNKWLGAVMSGASYVPIHVRTRVEFNSASVDSTDC